MNGEEDEEMVNVELSSYKIAKLKMNNDIPESGTVELESAVGFYVKYGENDMAAVAVLDAKIKNRHCPDLFFMDMELQGIFKMRGIDDIDAQKEAHLKCYDALFPYASQIMTYLAINSGMQGFALEKPMIQFASINFGTKPENSMGGGKVIKLWSDV